MNGAQRAQSEAPALGYGDYLRFSRLVEARYGLNFPEKRLPDLELGVRRAFAESTCSDLESFYALLQDPDSGSLHLQRLINALTVGESHFFRDAGQFDVLFQVALPEIIARRRALRTLRIWSAGCAGGEEPYSIAIALRELLPDVDEWAITILATDVNTEALARARQGLYSEWAFREARARQLRGRYFRPVDKHYELAPGVRRMVTFAALNLAEGEYPSIKTNTTFMDLILCRNVTIYFTPDITRSVAARFYDALTDGGWLVVGHSEHSLQTYRQFQTRSYPHAILYQRAGQPSAVTENLPVFSPPVVLPTPASLPPALEPVVVAAPTEDPLDVTLARAIELLEYGHSEQARDLLLGVHVSRTRDFAAVQALLGRAYANLGDWDAAERCCREAIRLDRLASPPYYTLALVLQHQGQIDAAISMMKKALYLDREFVLGHFGLADLYRSKGQLAQALKALDNAGRLLAEYPAEALVPDSGGITAANLRDTIIRQQQRWGMETVSLR